MSAEKLYSNGVEAAGGFSLSVAMPFFRNDPSPLITALAKQIGDLSVELLLVDDGSAQAPLTRIVEKILDDVPAPASLITFKHNQGRSAARNRLIASSRAPFILFLDSDMLPDGPDFLARWVELASSGNVEIAYGGYSTLQVPDCAALALAKRVAEGSDCASAAQRQAGGALNVATSNLLVAKPIFSDTPFDTDFSGWGWEDVDWALRAAAKGHAIRHVDIPATHLGLDEAAVLLDKFAKAGPNFRRMIDRHPEMADLRGTRLARRLSRIPGRSVLKVLCRATAMSEFMPLGLRALAARMWRASWAADSLA
jgi:glycosyltransferase involved in cell wall biosynthesis